MGVQLDTSLLLALLLAWVPGTLQSQQASGQPYETRIVVVAESGGHFASIQSAIDSITDASDDNRYLIYVAPGTYYERVTMKPFIDVEGCGEFTTVISAAGSSRRDEAPTLKGANSTELRSLTVENTGDALYGVAIENYAAAMDLTQVTARAYGAVEYNFGIYNRGRSPLQRIRNVTATAEGGRMAVAFMNRSRANPTMTDVSATAKEASDFNCGLYNKYATSPKIFNLIAIAEGGESSYGVFNENGDVYGPSLPEIHGSIMRASGGTNNYGVYARAYAGAPPMLVTVSGSQISGDTNALVNVGAQAVTMVATSMLAGGPVRLENGGSIKCAGVYDADFLFYSESCGVPGPGG